MKRTSQGDLYTMTAYNLLYTLYRRDFLLVHMLAVSLIYLFWVFVVCVLPHFFFAHSQRKKKKGSLLFFVSQKQNPKRTHKNKIKMNENTQIHTHRKTHIYVFVDIIL